MSLVRPEDISHLLLQAYEAAERPELWPRFLQTLRDLTSSQGASLIVHDLDTGEAMGATTGYAPDQERLYFDHYSTLNPWVPENRPSLPSGNVVRSEEIVPIAQLRRTEFYADWANRNDVVYSMMANLRISDGQFLYLTVNRGEQSGEHPNDTEALLHLLIPHLRRALHHQHQFEKSSLLRKTLDGLSLAIIVIDGNRRVIEMTKRASEMLSSKQHFRRSPNDGLQALTPALQGELDLHLQLLSTKPLPRSSAIRLGNEIGRPDSLLVITRDSAWASTGIASNQRFILTVVEPETSSNSAMEAVGAAFKLTKAEMRLVNALVTTGSLDRAIESLAINRNTAKTQMGAVFSKTRTNRQGELIKLVSHYSRVTHLGDD